MEEQNQNPDQDSPSQEPLPPPLPPKFLILGANTIIECGDEPLSIDRLMGIVLHLAAVEPEGKFYFWIKGIGEKS